MMLRRSLFAFTLASTLMALGLSAQEYKLGGKVARLAVTDLEGKATSIDLAGSGPTVVTFISTQCPVSNAYNDRMKAVHSDYTAKGVRFVFLNSNHTESAADITAHAKSHGFAFAVHKDDRNVLADAFGATVTPESFVFDKTGTMVYHGSLDDSQNEALVKRQGLRLALDSVLAGKPVEKAESKAFGCTIKRIRKAS